MENGNNHERRLDKLEEQPQKRKPMDVTFRVEYYHTIRDADGAVRDVKREIPEELYVTGAWQPQSNGDRWRVKHVPELPPYARERGERC